jgi:tetratricopeptide (TPR) repeat protein
VSIARRCELPKRRNDDHSLASAFNNMGLALEGIDRLDEALQAYQNALAVFRRIDDETGISTCYNNLGSACYAQGDFGRALKWYELDLALSQKRGNWTDMAATLHNLGHVALEQKTYDQALSYFEQSKELYAAFDLTDYVNEEGEMISYIQSLDPESNGG